MINVGITKLNMHVEIFNTYIYTKRKEEIYE